MAKITDTMRKQLAHVAHMTQFGGASLAGCGNGDYNRYVRLLKAGLVEWSTTMSTTVVISARGRAYLKGA